MRVCVLTTSYPRSPDDVAGVFVADAVKHLREAGVTVDVVSPADFRHFGIAFGDGIVQNLRARPWLVLALPFFLVNYARAARRAARDADVVHAHWIPSAIAARATRKPYVLQVWGTDVELFHRVSWLMKPLLRGPHMVIAASSFLADEARRLGAEEVRVVPFGVELPVSVGEPVDPPHVLYAGRLSEEKGILDFIQATEGMHRVIVGDGPLRSAAKESVGFVPPKKLGAYFSRAAVVCVPSQREGYGMIAREAMAHGRAVVASNVGGLRDAIEDGVTGVLVKPGDTAALRAKVAELLSSPADRQRIGRAARAYVEAELSSRRAVERLVEAYSDALGDHHPD